MDLVFIGLAWGCLLLSDTKLRDTFLCLVVAEFMLSAAWISLPGGPWWFLSYAVQNCLFGWLVMRTRHSVAREYAATLAASALIATAVFIQFHLQSTAIHEVRPTLMAWICVYQLWLAAIAAGLAEGTPLEVVRGIATRCVVRCGRAGADHAPGTVDREV